MPQSVDLALKRKAAERGISLNSVLLDALQREAGVGAPAPRYDDLDHLVGSWVEDPEMEEALKEQRRIDPRDWE